MSGATVAAAGWYGKLPATGDFASRRLPASFIDPWDAWLQQSMLASREMLRERWLEHYLIAPIARFVLGADVVGASAWVGILMPSVDRVGRHFPLTVAAELGREARLPATVALASWFEQIEGLALAALDPDATIETFDHGLLDHCLPDSRATDLSVPMDRATPSGTRWWHAQASVTIDERRFQGLPPPDSFTALLGGI